MIREGLEEEPHPDLWIAMPEGGVHDETVAGLKPEDLVFVPVCWVPRHQPLKVSHVEASDYYNGIPARVDFENAPSWWMQPHTVVKRLATKEDE